ncbi:type II/IV secretion system protein [Aggregatibacter actinomycetemcomitans]|uniref:GspE/PulE family protein n=1 Tax=Aggregatibacter actinomycetemcomitans TaxID=714 RepID=UPI00197C1F79|nr:GspE/PulE family protein [Aggregatibacter actinomycetemcomitans]MBN6082601.1 type II/IV secretion system protein [Aggregatibacter actinomycetemcomitans]
MQNPMAQGYSIHSQNHGEFTITPELWLKNQQQQTVLLRYLALPLAENGQTLWLGLDSLTNLSACEAFSFLTGKTIEPVLIESQTLKTALQDLSPRVEKVEENQPLFYSALSQEQPTQPSDEPIIRLLNDIFESATAQKASDIHLEPQADCLQIRFRIDGVLQVQNTVPLSMASRLISRLKLLAKLDISETRLPQDGRFQFKTTFSDTLDFRLSTLATQFGEKAVLRLQQNRPVQLAFGELGMTESQQQRFRRALSQPQGLILVTGPTGSGKSISLYTALQHLNTPEKHIMTAEDPIEIQLPGIIQSQVNPPIGLDFSRLLRTFLRQDPDIIMLGEIRDEESAAMALRAAQTGHLVLSTLHTNNASSAISRLQQLGIQRHEIDSSLLLVIAQRLVRKRCQKCGGNATHFCDCHQGYKGRVGVYQFLQPNSQHPQGYETDFADLRQSALEKLKDGTTDLAEIQRVLGQTHD